MDAKIALLTLPLLLQACSLQGPLVLAEGCVAEPRTDFELRLERADLNEIDQACRQLLKRNGHRPIPYLIGFHQGCAVTQCDAQLKPGERPVCEVIVPTGAKPGDPIWEEEMKHCAGFVHEEDVVHALSPSSDPPPGPWGRIFRPGTRSPRLSTCGA